MLWFDMHLMTGVTNASVSCLSPVRRRATIEQMLTYRDQTPQRPSYWNFVQRMYIYYAITSKC